VAAVIDPRLCLDSRVMTMNMWKKAIELFKKGYIDFSVTMKAFDRAKALEKNKKQKELVTTASTETESISAQAIEETVVENVNLCLSNSESVSEEFDAEAVLAARDKVDATLEGNKVAKRWTKFVSKSVNDKWCHDIFNTINPDILPKEGALDILEHLLQLDFEPIYNEVVKISKRKRFCLVPTLMCCSKYQLGALNSQSFAERINSAANRIVTEETIRINPSFVDKLVTL